MNGILRLIWTHLYLYQEVPSTTALKLDTPTKHPLHSTKLSIFHPDDRIELLIYMNHASYRHWERMMPLVIHRCGSAGRNDWDIIPRQDHNQAILHFHLISKGNGVPAWASTHDFTIVPPKDDYPTSSTTLPPILASPPSKNISTELVPSLVKSLISAITRLQVMAS